MLCPRRGSGQRCHDTYYALARRLLGAPAALVLRLAIMAFTLGFAAIYLVVIADILTGNPLQLYSPYTVVGISRNLLVLRLAMMASMLGFAAIYLFVIADILSGNPPAIQSSIQWPQNAGAAAGHHGLHARLSGHLPGRDRRHPHRQASSYTVVYTVVCTIVATCWCCC